MLVCGGSLGLTGAPCLASESAMRAGAGYVTAFVPASLNLVFETRLLEVMTVPLPDARWRAARRPASTRVLERVGRSDALVLGPGMGRAQETVELAGVWRAGSTMPLLLDADGLNAHAERLGALAERNAATVLTPHAGELGACWAGRRPRSNAHRLASVRARRRRAARAVVVLKGDDTIVADPTGRAAVNRGGAPALATAGTGDVLSGRDRGLAGQAHGPV